jgi:hypothetical protein
MVRVTLHFLRKSLIVEIRRICFVQKYDLAYVGLSVIGSDIVNDIYLNKQTYVTLVIRFPIGSRTQVLLISITFLFL